MEEKMKAEIVITKEEGSSIYTAAIRNEEKRYYKFLYNKDKEFLKEKAISFCRSKNWQYTIKED